MEITNIQCQIDCLKQCILLLRRNEEGARTEVDRLVPEITKTVSGLLEELNHVPDTENLITEILRRIQDFNKAYEGRDIILFSDVLEYEMMELFYLYIELLKNGERENVAGIEEKEH